MPGTVLIAGYAQPTRGEIECSERLGGVPKFYTAPRGSTRRSVDPACVKSALRGGNGRTLWALDVVEGCTRPKPDEASPCDRLLWFDLVEIPTRGENHLFFFERLPILDTDSEVRRDSTARGRTGCRSGFDKS